MENKEKMLDDFIKYAMKYFEGHEMTPSDIVRCSINLNNAAVSGLLDAIEDINETEVKN